MTSLSGVKSRILISLSLLLLAGAGAFVFSKSSATKRNSSFGQMLDAKWALYENTRTGWENENKLLKVIYFGFLSCPDVCPLALRNLQSALNELDDNDRKKTSVVFVSLDPERDTVQKLEESLAALHKDIVGVRPREDQIANLASAFMFHTERTALKESALQYIVSHPNRFYFVDLDNRLLEAVSETSGSGIAERVREILRSI